MKRERIAQYESRGERSNTIFCIIYESISVSHFSKTYDKSQVYYVVHVGTELEVDRVGYY